jgi:hypothetical protein
MSKSIRSYPEHERRKVIDRRIAKNAGGLGTLAAKDALKKIEQK